MNLNSTRKMQSCINKISMWLKFVLLIMLMLQITYLKGTVVRGIDTLHADAVVHSVRERESVRLSVPGDADPE